MLREKCRLGYLLKIRYFRHYLELKPGSLSKNGYLMGADSSYSTSATVVVVVEEEDVADGVALFADTCFH